MKILNFFGGPGVGKSTIASYVFSQMKAMGKYKVELVTEYAKDCVYEGKTNILKVDQLYVFAKQNHKLKMIQEYSENIDFIITDSPLILSNIYGEINNSINDEFKALVTSIFNSYENVNFLINRKNQFLYEKEGRIQNDEEAAEIQGMVKQYLIDNSIIYEDLNVNRGFLGIMDQILASKQMD